MIKIKFEDQELKVRLEYIFIVDEIPTWTAYIDVPSDKKMMTFSEDGVTIDFAVAKLTESIIDYYAQYYDLKNKVYIDFNTSGS